MHSNVRPPDATPDLIRINYDTHAKFEVAQPIYCRLIAFLLLSADSLLHAVILTSDLEHLYCIACDMMKPVRNLSEIEQPAVELLRFEYLTL